MRFAVFISSRVTFPQHIVTEAINELAYSIQRNGHMPLIPPNPVTNEAQAREYAAFLTKNREHYDGVIAVFPNFGDESSAMTALRDANTPILMLAYPDEISKMGASARRDSFCGKISAMNLFKQCRIPFTALKPHTVHPKSANFDSNLKTFSSICRVVNGIKRIRTGSIGTRCTSFKTVRFDETTLERYGISNEAFDLSEVFIRYRAIKDSNDSFRRNLAAYQEYCSWPRGSDDAMARIAKLATVIDDMIAEYNLDLITLRCWTELESELKISPCVILSMLNTKKITANCEVDTVNAVAMRALSLAADAPATCLDWNNNWGDEENRCVLFHCGSVAADLMRKKGEIVDSVFFVGALGEGNCLGCTQGRMKPGRFTCSSGFTRDGRLSFLWMAENSSKTNFRKTFSGVPELQSSKIFRIKCSPSQNTASRIMSA